jgi:hypothetical protein
MPGPRPQRAAAVWPEQIQPCIRNRIFPYLCALQQESHLSPAGRPCPHAWARSSTDVSATTCPSDLHISAERRWSLQQSHMKPIALPADLHWPAMGPVVARRPRRPGAALLPTNAFHTTFSRGNSAGKASEALGRGFASFQISTRPRAWADPAGPARNTRESVVGHFCGKDRIVKYCVVVLNYLFGVSKNSQLPCLASFLV